MYLYVYVCFMWISILNTKKILRLILGFEVLNLEQQGKGEVAGTTGHLNHCA
jgi:hypothetical protein